MAQSYVDFAVPFLQFCHEFCAFRSHKLAGEEISDAIELPPTNLCDPWP